jgi:Tfp pilus assembly protein PilF
LRNGNIAAALKDLDSITDTNRQHFGAFQAKARIYQELGITKLAVVNFSQVIKLKPDDADGYLQRATLFESENVRRKKRRGCMVNVLNTYLELF